MSDHDGVEATPQASTPYLSRRSVLRVGLAALAAAQLPDGLVSPAFGQSAKPTDNLIYWDYTGTKLVPNIARAWEVSADGRVTTVHLRRGMKWSDGHPFTADDFVFWFEDVYSNKDLVPTPLSVMTINGKPISVRK